MKRVLMPAVFCLALLLVSGAQPGPLRAGVWDSPLNGPYLGQEPPGPEPRLFAPGIVSTGSNELSIAFSPDSHEVFFFVTSPSYTPRFILHSRLEGEIWTQPREVPFRDSRRSDSYPFLAPDGKTLFFCSGRAVDGGPSHHHEIFAVSRSETGWGEPKKVVFGEEKQSFGTFPSVATNGNLYFNWGSGATGSDIFVAELDDEARYSEPRNLGPAVNSDAGDFHPFIAPDESYLLFDSVRDGSLGGNDIYISFRQEDGTWSEAQNLGPAVNTRFADLRPFVTADNHYLFFASSRPQPQEIPDSTLTHDEVQGLMATPGNGLQDIYWVSAEVIPGNP